MKKLYHFQPMILLSLLVSIAVILFEACIFINGTLLDTDIYSRAMNEKKVTDAMYDELAEYFKSLSNATGIPAEVFTDPLDKEELYTTSFKLLQESINYITDENSPAPSINFDYSKVEKSITDYIEKHAEENNIEKNDEYHKLLNNTIKTAKEQIESRFDVMMLYTLSKQSPAEWLHEHSGIFKIGTFVFIAIAVILVALMLFLDRHHPRDYPYWAGLILAVSSGFWLIPAVYLKSTNYFDAFFIRNEYIYKSVTGLFDLTLDHLIKLHAVLLIIGVVLIISTLVIHYSYIHYLKKQYHKTHDND